MVRLLHFILNENCICIVFIKLNFPVHFFFVLLGTKIPTLGLHPMSLYTLCKKGTKAVTGAVPKECKLIAQSNIIVPKVYILVLKFYVRTFLKK